MSIYRFLENRKACVLSNTNTMTTSQFVCRACDEFPLEFLENKKHRNSIYYEMICLDLECLPKLGPIIGDPCTNDAESWNAISSWAFLFFRETFFVPGSKNYIHRTTFKLPRKKGRKFLKRYEAFAGIKSAFNETTQSSSSVVCLFFLFVKYTPPLTLSWGPFLERPGNLTGPVSYFEIKFSRKVCCFLTSSEAHFVSLANNFTVPFSKLLKLPSLMENKTA